MNPIQPVAPTTAPTVIAEKVARQNGQTDLSKTIPPASLPPSQR